MTKKFRLQTNFFWITTFSFLIAACGGSSGYGKKNEFHINIGAEPASLHPIMASDGYASVVKGYVLDSLLTQDPETLEWKPNAAESWEVSKDGMTFTFKLRQGLTFSDGSPLTAEDVKCSFDAIFDAEYNAIHIRPYYSLFEKLEVVDPLTVKFKLKEKYFQNFEFAAASILFLRSITKTLKRVKKLTSTFTVADPIS